MYQLLKQIAKIGIVTEPAPLPDAALRALEQRLGRVILERFGRALAIRHVDAGSCNGCELEIHAMNSPYYNLEGLGIKFVASPRRADRDARDRGRSAAALPRLQHLERSGARGDLGAGARRRNRRDPPATVGKIPAGTLLLGADRAAAALRGFPGLRSETTRAGAAPGQLAGRDRRNHLDPDSGDGDLRRNHRNPAQPRGDESVFLTGSGLQVSVALLLLKMRDLHHARGHELDPEDELVLLQLAVAQRDLAHLELHAPAHQILYARVEGAEAVLGALHEEIDAVGVSHRNELRLR